MMKANPQAQAESDTRPSIWAVGGGKGGVGKSVVSILLSLALARNHQRTVLVDADLGGANLHTFLGIKNPVRTLNDYVTRKYANIEEIPTRTQVSGLDLICGASEILSLANPQFGQKFKIMQSMSRLSADHVILDLGAGSSYNVLDFFLIADHPIVVLTPEPVSIQNAYAFVRNCVYRKLNRMANQQSSLQEVIYAAMDPKNENQLRTIVDLYQAVRKSHGAGVAGTILQAVSRIRPMIVTNMIKEEKDANAGSIIAMVAEKYLTICSMQLGAIVHDPAVEKMVSQMTPLSDLPENSPAWGSAQAIVLEVISKASGRVQIKGR
jgi:flagellar biosynthesis protein FlhG